ncbi:MAG: hypothetical protein KatS3mg129_1552 [Leptospiraceae bacterium]|nr:MAG: hypothetical protein KatS3mg129_1552 [Leptospiraceae bacterium]
MNEKKTNTLQNISLFFGEITEQLFYQLRELITITLQFLKKQLIDVSDHPNLKYYFSQINIKEVDKNLEDIHHFSKESLLKLLFTYSEFLTNIIEFLKPLEPSLINSLFKDIYIPSLFSDTLLKEKSFDVYIKSKNRILTEENIIYKIDNSLYNNICFLFPSLISDESTWENNKDNQYSIDNLLIQKNIFPIKFQLNPTITLQENTEIVFQKIKTILNHLEKNNKQFYFIAFSTGNYIVRSLLFHYNHFFHNKLKQIVMINSPELGLRLERFIFWAGLGYQYDPVTSLKLLRILTDKRFKIFNEFDNCFLFQKDFISREIGIIKTYHIIKIYSLITENNSIWSPWLGDGFIEESSLSFYDDIISEKNIFLLNGISHLQILTSPELKNILNQIF